MRIAYFTDTYRIGGAERFLADLVAGVAGAGHDVAVVSPQASVLDLVGESATGVDLVGTRVDYSAVSSWQDQLRALARASPELRAVISRLRPNVLHVSNGGHPGSDLNRLATIVARFAGKPKCVLSVHSPASSRSVSQPQLQALSDWLVWRSVDAVHSATLFQARSMSIRSMPPSLLALIPYGVHEPDGPSAEVALLRSRLVSGGRLLVGMVAATGEAEKGHAVFVEALAQSGVDAIGVVVGRNPGASLAQQIERLNLTERVHLEGRVASVGPYVNAIDLLVVPSTAFESLPLVVLEAMAAGKPVFASRLSGIPEAVIDGVTGRLFEPGDVDALSALLREAVRDRGQLERFGRAGKERWREEFSVDAMTQRMLGLYAELASPRA
jgi:glycosyltransferase involved in cell wall biosynthesis